ncbi:MAG: nucleotidyltransferase [Kiritimatiellae bacterium]|nr:nucleotidyltransferase [Kiritimatiellia bacterium]
MSDVSPTLVVLAAGMGSRYGGLKQIDPVGPHGEVVLDYSVFDALRAGFGRVVFLIRKDLEAAFAEQILPRYEGRIEAGFAYQELAMLPEGFTVPEGRAKPWGTAHAVLCCRTAIQGPFAVINADDFYGAESYRVLADFFRAPAPDHLPLYSLVGFQLSNTLSEHGTVARAICETDAMGYLQTAEEMTAIAKTPGGARNTYPDGRTADLTGRERVSMNMWGFDPTVFDLFDGEFVKFLQTQSANLKSEFFIPTAVSGLIAKNAARCRILPTSSTWFGVTYREDKPLVQASIRRLVDEGLYPARLWA